MVRDPLTSSSGGMVLSSPVESYTPRTKLGIIYQGGCVGVSLYHLFAHQVVVVYETKADIRGQVLGFNVRDREEFISLAAIRSSVL